MVSRFVLCFLLGALTLLPTASPDGTNEELDDNFYWIGTLPKYLFGLHTIRRILKNDNYRQVVLRPPDNPWGLLGQPCNELRWLGLAFDFVHEGDDPVYFLKKLNDHSADELKEACLFPGTSPTMRCMSPTPAPPYGGPPPLPPQCHCLESLSTPYNFKPFPEVNPTKCLSQFGALCTSSGTMMCEKALTGQACRNNVCGGAMGAELFNSIDHGSIRGRGYAKSRNQSEVHVKIDTARHQRLAESKDPRDLQDSFFMTTSHPVLLGCNVDQFKRVAQDFENLMELVSVNNETFDTKFVEFIQTAMFPSSELYMQLAYEVFKYRFGSGTPVQDNIMIAQKGTIRCLENFPATRCVNTLVPETQQPGSALTGQCICSDVERLKYFRYVTRPSESGSGMHCRAKEGSIRRTMNGPTKCDDGLVLTVIPSFTGKIVARGEFYKNYPSVVSTFEFHEICSKLPEEPPTSTTSDQLDANSAPGLSADIVTYVTKLVIGFILRKIMP